MSIQPTEDRFGDPSTTAEDMTSIGLCSFCWVRKAFSHQKIGSPTRVTDPGRAESANHNTQLRYRSRSVEAVTRGRSQDDMTLGIHE